ncbi:AAA domain-containing protein [Halogranum amylolyticum]|uniref:AAA domain-containing protein n=1 Tax=Halogranum amylolyticum TaxID=660520 RepID=A0A1H8WUH1_9EURY|nr:archaea-specific SMC-related protein [Halogranum amylolyticum]SEP31133.1 AAA domain-containing protein [Halogranum amylolyticum]
MESRQFSAERAELQVRNIGGIDETAVTLEHGVTALTGRNATNRTSLLQAIMAALGSDNVSIKRDADEAHVELQFGDETYSRTLRRRNGSIVSDGTPFLEDPELGDLFAFLLEMNEARQAVARGDDLHELVMRPVDTDAIQAEISELQSTKRDIDAELDDLDGLKRRLPGLEEKRTKLQSQIDDQRAELEEKREALEEFDADVEESREEQSELDAKLQELRETESALEDVRFDMDTERDSLEALRADRDEVSEERSELPTAPDDEIQELDKQIQRLRGQSETIDSVVSELQSLIQFNEEMLEGGRNEFQSALQPESNGSVTDQLVETDTTVCWTCGSEVETGQIEDTLDRLRELRSSKLSTRNELTSEIDDLQSKKRSLEGTQKKKQRLDRRLDEIEDEIRRREHTVEDLETREDELIDELAELETEVDELETEEYSEVLDRHKEANQLEFEVQRLEKELSSVEDEIRSVEDRLAERDELETRREEIQEELEELRTRIERIEQQMVDEFNEHMDAVLGELAYENIDRIWIERTEREVREGRRKVTKSHFDLHIIRSAADGRTYEDTVDHLSESEREVTGLIFALAGYLAHDVYETLPFILLDSLEAIDSERIAKLIDYMTDYADYLVVALLPEDAAAVDDRYARVTDI